MILLCYLLEFIALYAFYNWGLGVIRPTFRSEYNPFQVDLKSQVGYISVKSSQVTL
jgi:hypothetical protein